MQTSPFCPFALLPYFNVQMSTVSTKVGRTPKLDLPYSREMERQVTIQKLVLKYFSRA